MAAPNVAEPNPAILFSGVGVALVTLFDSRRRDRPGLDRQARGRSRRAGRRGGAGQRHHRGGGHADRRRAHRADRGRAGRAPGPGSGDRRDGRPVAAPGGRADPGGGDRGGRRHAHLVPAPLRGPGRLLRGDPRGRGRAARCSRYHNPFISCAEIPVDSLATLPVSGRQGLLRQPGPAAGRAGPVPGPHLRRVSRLPGPGRADGDDWCAAGPGQPGPRGLHPRLGR